MARYSRNARAIQSFSGGEYRKKALFLLMVLCPAMASDSFKYVGVVEGFYGKPYSFQARKDMMRFLERWGMNLYLYGPKDDPYHRKMWRLPYPERMRKHFKELIDLGKLLGVTFCYAISPGLDVRYSSRRDRKLLFQKLSRFLKMGATCLAIFFDDISPQLSPEDRIYKNAGEAQADLINEVFLKLKRQRKNLLFIVVPTEYAGTKPSPYKESLKHKLDPDVLLMWTGEGVISKKISAEEAKRFQSVYGRKPLIWDNYPVNDFAPGQLFLGPYQGRDPLLSKETLGILCNPMIQPYASWIPLFTFASFVRAPRTYSPQKAWLKALGLFGKEAKPWLYEVAVQLRRSKLGHKDDVSFRKLVMKLRLALKSQDKEKHKELLAKLRLRLEKMAQTKEVLGKLLEKHPLGQELLPFAKKLSAYGKALLLYLHALEERGEQAPPKKKLRAQLAVIEKSKVHLCRPACQLLFKSVRERFIESE